MWGTVSVKLKICKQCEKLGLKSYVMVGPVSTELAYFQPHYDENGVYHVPSDNNKTKIHYSCTNGCWWTERESDNEQN